MKRYITAIFMLAFSMASYAQQMVYECNLSDRYAAFWNSTDLTLPESVAQQIDLYALPGQNVLSPSGGTVAFALSASAVYTEGLGQYLSSKLSGMYGLSLVYSENMGSMAKIVVSIDVSGMTLSSFLYRFTVSSGQSLEILVPSEGVPYITTSPHIRISYPEQAFGITLSSSSYGTVYTLLRDGSVVADSMNGNGGPLTFYGSYGSGTYTVNGASGSVVVVSSPDANYTSVRTMLDKDGTSEIEDIVFYNGLGDPIQKVSVGASPAGGKNLVYPVYYDNFRRSGTREYLPYVSVGSTPDPDTSPFSSQQSYYSDVFPSDADYAFSRSDLESSPLSRTLRSFLPGRSFQSGSGHYAAASYGTNGSSGDSSCRRFRAIGVLDDVSLSIDGIYPSGTLHVTTVTDERGTRIMEFIDSDERLILARVIPEGGVPHDTYYVYDIYGNLCFVLPPELSSRITNTISQTLLDCYAFVYRYDGRNRRTYRRLPGAVPDIYLYDAADRMTSRSRGSGSSQQTWHYSYDGSGRLQSESFTSSGTSVTLRTIAYRHPSLPPQLAFLPVSGIVAEADIIMGVQQPGAAYEIMSKVGTTGTLSRSYFYDHRGRVVQIREYDGEWNSTISYLYDFVGNVLIHQERHESSFSGSSVLDLRFQYDSRSRIISSVSNLTHTPPSGSQQISSSSVSYGYDDLGRMTSRILGTGSGAIALNYSHDIRGWLLSQSGGEYDAVLSYMDATLASPSYTGDIVQWGWSRGNSTPQKTYAFSYDGMGRLTSGELYEGASKTDRYSEKAISYDRNGNITSLTRVSGGSSSSYTCVYDGNHLVGASTSAGSVTSTYDSFGRTLRDGIRNVDIEWNSLDLIEKVSRGATVLASYSYLSDGKKLSALDGTGDGFLYRGSLTYRKSGSSVSIEGADFSDGRFMSLSGVVRPYYHVTDHLGSVRTVIDGQSGQVVERNDYYPFGGRWEDSGSLMMSANRYRYNGKEEQSGEFGVQTIDYGARHYTPISGRWLSMDPLAESYYSTSPYVFCNNNPVNYVDLDGEDVWEINPSGIITWVEDSDEHRLYYVNADGNRSDNYVTVNNRRILDAFAGKDGTASYTDYSDIDDFFKVFLFAADNSNVEWALHRGQDNSYTIGTKRNKLSAGHWEDYGLTKMPVSSVHSHPDEPNTIDKEIGSMSYDYKNVEKEVMEYGQQMRLNYVYFPNSTRLYHVEPSGVRYIHSINNNFRRFYFGTLNHR